MAALTDVQTVIVNFVRAAKRARFDQIHTAVKTSGLANAVPLSRDFRKLDAELQKLRKAGALVFYRKIPHVSDPGWGLPHT